ARSGSLNSGFSGSLCSPAPTVKGREIPDIRPGFRCVKQCVCFAHEKSMKHSAQKTTSGIPALDDVLHGGLVPGRLYLIDGNPGSGKTTLALQFLLAGVHLDERCLYVTLSETRQELLDGAASHNWSLNGIEIVEFIADQEEWERDGPLTMIQPADVEL